MTRVLVIEDDDGIRENILELMDAEGFDAVGACNGKDGVIAAISSPPDVIICDIAMPELDGFGVLRSLRDRRETASTAFIFLTARADRSDLRQGMSMGADDYVTKPFTREELLAAIRARLDRRTALAAPSEATAPATTGPSSPARAEGRKHHLIIESPVMKALYDEAGKAAASMISVLITGETGTGKEVLARELHERSPRAAGPFVPVNCAALSESLLESELFGHAKGAFTGAVAEQAGVFEAANGGTIFLDEIGEMSVATQAKLLRVLEDRTVTRVGSREIHQIDVRFVAATNRDLRGDIEEGRFRSDLYFRINGTTLQIPPLRERSEEVELLARSFAEIEARSLGRECAPTIHSDALEILKRYAWPGNVRELRNVMERAVAMSTGEQIIADNLPGMMTSTPNKAPSAMEKLRGEMEELERQRIVSALESCGGNQTKAAALLGISRRTLVSRLDTYGLPRPRKK